MLSWLLTRNTYEAAALAALYIPPRPHRVEDHARKRAPVIEWTLSPESTPDNPAGVTFSTGALRQQAADGTLEKTQPLHPYLIALQTMHNRERWLDFIKAGKAMVATPTTPSFHPSTTPPLQFFKLTPAPGGPLPSAALFFETHDLDLAIALSTAYGAGPRSAEGPDGQKLYKLSVRALTDLDEMKAWRAGTLNIRLLKTPFAIALQALEALRECRRHMESNRFIAITTGPRRGAFLNEKALRDHVATTAIKTRTGIKL